MRLWRLTRAPFAAAAFDGTGAARGGARWNSRGVHVAYGSSSRALAILEVLVHVTRENAPGDYVFIEAEVPDDAIDRLDAAQLPAGWRTEPPPPSLRAVGDEWVRTNRSLALRVPSAVVPEECNVLVNPRHARFAELRIQGSPQPMILDPRLLERIG
ncbi:MAG: RES family NAD+ phosphorylase [Candidatus Eremiobacteraeota bacterium]|nr:RES family NAD+ phosphorylase [Candidatus Eremiobacteraeota bacterium]